MGRFRSGASARFRKIIVFFLVGSVVAVGTLVSSATVASAQTTTIANSAATCSFSGTVTFTPPLTATGGGTGQSSIDATLSGCSTNSFTVESFASPQLEGTFASSPFTCSSSSPTDAVLSAVITWNAAAFPSGGIAATTVDGSSAAGSFAGAASLNLQVPSDIAAGCTDGAVSTDSVSGSIAVGPACGEVGDPLSIYPIVPPICGAQAHMPTSITSGSDGALWFTTDDANLIGRTTTAGVTTFYPAPLGAQGTWGTGGITTGSDGALWFLAEGGAAIGRMTTSGSVTTFPLPSGDNASAVTPGPDGALWFTILSSGSNAIGRITTSGHMRTYTSKILGTVAYGKPSFNRLHHRIMWDITAGPYNTLWFSEEEYSNLGRAWIGTITTSGLIKDRELPRGAHPGPLTEGPDGAIWFGTSNPNGGNAIGRVTTSKKFVVSRFSSPGDVGQVLGITAGPDGALWFTNYSVPGDTGFVPVPSVGRLTTAGAFTTYGSAYVTEGAVAITTGPDGAMWFIDHLNDTLGRITVP